MLYRCTAFITLAAFFLFSGCYNTYSLQQEEFSKLQRADESGNSKVSSKAGKELTVTRDSSLFVRSEGGRRYPITPFNFKVTNSQLVAPDRDHILMLDQVKSYEVDVPSTNKTIALIAGGALAATGLVVGLFLTQGEKER